MSGIEAAFGVAASGAGLLSLSIQLLECATKLKRLQHTARNAPQTLAKLVFELETMGIALRTLEQRRQQESPSETLLARCVMSCQQCTADISRLVDRLEKSTTNIIGKVYFAFKQREVMEMLDSLEKAKSSLQLAYTMYQTEEQRRHDQAHAHTLALQSLMIRELQAQLATGNAHLSNQLQLVTQTSAFPQHQRTINDLHRLPPFGSETLATFADGRDRPRCTDRNRTAIQRRTSRRKRDARLHMTFRLPTWISRRIYAVALVQLESGWDLFLRSENLIQDDSLVFHYARAGNLEGMKTLFETGKATPLDVARPGNRAYWFSPYGDIRENFTLLEITFEPAMMI
ncbi:hypothetical protein H2200_001992 [Cladophialophora chaetospira]|uniref:Fungal N-terminal domain-containing protein n=1 Tax=Cladophialophora chaetospira TaxID=386627 RepID=A0AA38XM85_9EURO|nr:hypothetical protein H2200_001992 [Cladophialophora chaetospira]